MTLDDFAVEKAAFEVRFGTALLHWDRAGAFWTSVIKKEPALRMLNAEPGKTVFALRRDYQLSVELDKASVVADDPDAKFLDEMATLADLLTSAIQEQFEIVEYSRVGFRNTFFHKTASLAEATKSILELNRVRVPDAPLFNSGKDIAAASLAIKWEGDPFGAQVRLNADGRKIDFEPGFGAKEIPPYHEVRHGVTFDVDYFSTKPIQTGQFRASEWIRQAHHVIRRDGSQFLTT